MERAAPWHCLCQTKKRWHERPSCQPNKRLDGSVQTSCPMARLRVRMGGDEGKAKGAALTRPDRE